MSGGYFGYDQRRIYDIAETVGELIETNDDESINDWGSPRGRGFSPEVIAEFRNGLDALRRAYVYAQRIDWLVSGDDGEDNFMDRLRRELASLDGEK